MPAYRFINDSLTETASGYDDVEQHRWHSPEPLGLGYPAEREGVLPVGEGGLLEEWALNAGQGVKYRFT